MTRSRRLGRRVARVLSLAGSAALVITTATDLTAASPAAADGPTITGTGSSYAALAIDQWAAELSTEGTNINYSTQSSVIGLNDFAQYPQVDFGASEIGYSTHQASQEPPAGFSYQYLPDIAGATCLDYNVFNQLGQKISNLKLNPSVMVGIFSGSITKWNDPAIAALNPGVLLPSSPIVVVYRTDASGDNFIFSDYLYTTEPSAWTGFTNATQSPSGAQAIWPTAPAGARQVGPYDFGNWTGESGSDNASNYVYSNLNTITYVETGYALLHSDPCAEVENGSGNYVAPSEAADAIALQNDQLQPDLEQNLTPVFQSPQSGAYPISAYSYLVMAEQSEIPPAKQSVEAAFVQFLACRGQQAAGALGYSPLPANLVQADFDAIGRITGTPLPPPTASNCPDPYITGSFNAAPPPTVGGSPNSSAGSSAAGPSGGGAAVSPVASTPSKASASSTSASASSTSASASSTSGGTAGAHHRSQPVVLAPPSGQVAGVAMKSAVDGLLGSRIPMSPMALATVAFAAILVGPPVFGLLRRRRPATGAHGGSTGGDGPP